MLSLRRTLASASGRRLFSTTLHRKDTYGFIGLGQMGLPMARNLRKNLTEDNVVYVYDINTAASASLSAELPSVKVAKDVSELVEAADTVITMLPQPAHVASLFQGIVANPPATKKHRLFIDSSTIDVATSLSTGKLVSSSMDATFVDAPVSGGVVGASAGTLTFLLGAPEALRPRVTSILERMGARILPCGGPGSGLAGKLANNYLLAISNIGVAEAMNLGLQLGLDVEVLKGVINSSSGRCWSSEVNNPIDNEKKGFEGGFGTALMMKDLKLAMAAAEESGARLEMAAPAEQVYQKTLDKEGNKDFSVVYRWLKGQ